MAGGHMDDIHTPTGTAAGVASASALSWGAILAGTAAAAAASLLLFALATGLDLASISAWPRRVPSAASVTVVAAIALVATQSISAALGGYITGRLRTRWVGTHTHEVFFRDTAHGFITWCMATVLLASGLIPAPSSFMSAAVRAGAVPAARPLVTDAAAAGAAAAYQPELILPAGPAGVTDSGGAYFVPLSAAQSAIADTCARCRLDDAADAVDAADVVDARAARDAAASSILTALAMLVGAFTASVSAALGGRLRDLHP
jgi:hypothetical protein